ncbi:MAG TPA: hypothetical protein VNO21_25585 [Polyangiaceae bacterium]|nr:hypothetical protein [Polyangiaceae bacterium]
MNETLETSTGASRVETDQGPGYAKFLGNPEGPQALFCELVGTRAASWLGLPTFEVAVVDVGEPGLVTYADGSKSQAGPAFITRQEIGTTWGGTASELMSVQNLDVLAGLVVLDTWLLNCDRYRPEGDKTRRNTRNVFLSGREAAKGKFRVVAMDHTHCFTCGRTITKAIGNIDRVRDTRLYGHFAEFRPHLTHEFVRGFARKLSDLNKATVDGFVASIPRPWDVSAEVRAAVTEFLADRAAFLSQNIRQMLMDQGELQPELELGE